MVDWESPASWPYPKPILKPVGHFESGPRWFGKFTEERLILSDKAGAVQRNELPVALVFLSVLSFLVVWDISPDTYTFAHSLLPDRGCWGGFFGA